eukprot:TRINITY_DN1878_c1_g1_i1.p1 TRINITY_DN1878_c1_g1~~TRINITY_DN1878_c1_g1_i1.p1  ORF type:complete len:398 (-),score=135.41 TRINITY_DN1878_c1_g1_i1:168-1361(-)
MILSIPDPLQGIHPGIEYSFDLSLFDADSNIKLTGLPTIADENSDFYKKQVDPAPIDELATRFNISKKPVSEYDPTTDIENVNTKIPNSVTAAKVLASSEPQIKQINTKIESEQSRLLTLNQIYDQSNQQYQSYLLEKSQILITLGNYHKHIKTVETELALLNDQLFQEIEWLHTAPSTLLELAKSIDPTPVKVKSNLVLNELSQINLQKNEYNQQIHSLQQQLMQVKYDIDLIQNNNYPPPQATVTQPQSQLQPQPQPQPQPQSHPKQQQPQSHPQPQVSSVQPVQTKQDEEKVEKKRSKTTRTKSDKQKDVKKIEREEKAQPPPPPTSDPTPPERPRKPVPEDKPNDFQVHVSSSSSSTQPTGLVKDKSKKSVSSSDKKKSTTTTKDDKDKKKKT